MKEVLARLATLGEIYLGRRPASNSPRVSLAIEGRPGAPEATSERVVVDRRPRAGRLVYAHRLAVDPERVAAAWEALGAEALGDAILLDADPVRDGVVGGPEVWRWTGVETSGGNARTHMGPHIRLFEHYAVRTCGTIVLGKSVRIARSRAEDYRREVGHVDWSAEDVWLPTWSTRLTDIAAVDVHHDREHGFKVLLWGRRPTLTFWSVGPKTIIRHGVLTVQRADDGRWSYACGYRGLGPYYRWREEQKKLREEAGAYRPTPAEREDDEALVGYL